jgi:hypothetical protein
VSCAECEQGNPRAKNHLQSKDPSEECGARDTSGRWWGIKHRLHLRAFFYLWQEGGVPGQILRIDGCGFCREDLTACYDIRMSDDAKENLLDKGKETAIVEEKVATAEGSMTNRIMFTEVMVAEEQDMAGNNMDFHKSRDEITRLVSNDNTGVLESEQQAQDIQKEDLKRAAMQERRRRENNAQVLRCNRDELKVLALTERRNRESIAEVIKHQSTPKVDSEASNRAELKRRALEERRMKECDRHNLSRNLVGALLMRGRHPELRGNEKKANVGQRKCCAATRFNTFQHWDGGRAGEYQQSSSLNEGVVRKVGRKLQDSSN